jgi:cell division protein FtsL
MHDKVLVALLAALITAALGCVTVRPEQRAILADRIMQFGADARERAALEHAIENREGSSGAGSVQGGGCGCN